MSHWPYSARVRHAMFRGQRPYRRGTLVLVRSEAASGYSANPMLNHVANGFTLLLLPRRAWTRIAQMRYSALALTVYTGALALFFLFFRGIGNLLSGMGVALALLETVLFTLISVGTSLSIGLILMPLSKLARRPTDDGHAMKLALFSSTPFWLYGFFQVVPWTPVRIIVLLLSLGHACLLLFRGLPTLFGTEPTHTLIVSLVISLIWVVGLVLFTQIFLGLAFAL